MAADYNQIQLFYITIDITKKKKCLGLKRLRSDFVGTDMNVIYVHNSAEIKTVLFYCCVQKLSKA